MFKIFKNSLKNTSSEIIQKSLNAKALLDDLSIWFPGIVPGQLECGTVGKADLHRALPHRSSSLCLDQDRGAVCAPSLCTDPTPQGVQGKGEEG